MKTTAPESDYSEDIHQDTEMHFHDPFLRKDVPQLCSVVCRQSSAVSPSRNAWLAQDNHAPSGGLHQQLTDARI